MIHSISPIAPDDRSQVACAGSSCDCGDDPEIWTGPKEAVIVIGQKPATTS